eukprot:g450.t1
MEFLTSNDEAAAFVAPPAAAACAPEQPPSAVDLTFDTVQHSRDFFREAGVVFALLREVVSSRDHEHDEPDKNPCDASDVEHQKRKELLAEKRAKAEEVKRIWNLYQEQPALLDGSSGAEWATVYVLYLWLAMVLYSPFDLTTILSNTDPKKHIFHLSLAGLEHPSRLREAAAFLLGKLFARKDCVALWGDFVALCRASFGIDVVEKSETSTATSSFKLLAAEAEEEKRSSVKAPASSEHGRDGQEQDQAAKKKGIKRDPSDPLAAEFRFLGLLQAINQILKASASTSSSSQDHQQQQQQEGGGSGKDKEKDNGRATSQATESSSSNDRLANLQSLFAALLDAGKTTGGSFSAKERFDTNSLAWKFRVKSLARIVEKFLPNKPPKWRYQRGVRLLGQDLVRAGGEGKPGAGPRDAVSEEASADMIVGNYEEDERSEAEIIPNATLDLAEEVIELLLQSLLHSDTIVRWSAAKCFGRITAKLSSLFLADQVIEALEERCFQQSLKNDRAWHGGCLALAELARRGLLLPARLESVLPIVCEALSFEFNDGALGGGQTSAGQHVRDAACYCVWAFARAYEGAHFAPFRRQLAAALLPAACFDREINIRRAAAAAIQEHVGRQDSFPHGIRLVTAADFFTVSCRKRAYAEVASAVASLDPDYRFYLVSHLLDRKLEHPDVVVREECAGALGELLRSCGGSGTSGTSCREQGEEVEDNFALYANEVVLPRLAGNVVVAPAASGRATASTSAAAGTSGAGGSSSSSAPLGCPAGASDAAHQQKNISVPLRHGSLLALAEIVRRNNVPFTEKTQTLLRNLIPNGEKQRMYRGRGGEIIRFGAMKLLKAICCNSFIKFPKPAVKKYYLQSIEDCLYHSGDSRIQFVAMEALSFLLEERLSGGTTGVVGGAGREEETKILHDFCGKQLEKLDFGGGGGGSSSGGGDGVVGTEATGEEQVIPATAEAAAQPQPPPKKEVVPLATRNGALLALGWLACYVKCAKLREKCVLHLCSEITTAGDFLPIETQDPVSRQYAVFSLGRVLLKTKISSDFDSSNAERVKTAVKDALLHAFQDYEVDRRGDVGSWVREMALDVVCHYFGWASDEASASEPKIFAAILQQCMEKIDRTRLIAFSALCRILRKKVLSLEESAAFQIAASRSTANGSKEPIANLLAVSRFIPGETTSTFFAAEELQEICAWKKALDSALSAADETSEDEYGLFLYPKLVGLLDCPGFRRRMLIGLLNSVGGVTESTAKASSKALFDYCESDDLGPPSEGFSAGRRTNVGDELNNLFKGGLEAKERDRLELCLLNVVGLLLSKGLWPESAAEELFLNTYALIQTKQARSNIGILRSAVTVFLGLLQFEETPTRRKALRATLLLLGHRFPKLREAVAQSLYMSLQQYSTPGLVGDTTSAGGLRLILPLDGPPVLATSVSSANANGNEETSTACSERGDSSSKESVPAIRTSEHASPKSAESNTISHEKIESVCNLLVETAWMAEDGSFNQPLGEIHDLLQLPKPVLKKALPKKGGMGNAGSGQSAKQKLLIKREVEGYAQLVREFHNV